MGRKIRANVSQDIRMLPPQDLKRAFKLFQAFATCKKGIEDAPHPPRSAYLTCAHHHIAGKGKYKVTVVMEREIK